MDSSCYRNLGKTDAMIRTSAAIVILILASNAQAEIATFDDLVPQSIPVGNIFTSDDLSFDVIAFGGGTQVFISDSSPTDNFLNLNFEVGVQVAVPANIISGSFEYFNGFNFNVLNINGDQIVVSDFAVLNGFNLGGVDLTVGGGLVEMDGAISTLSIGGTETGIDNLRLISIPEPTSAIALLALTSYALLRRGSRR